MGAFPREARPGLTIYPRADRPKWKVTQEEPMRNRSTFASGLTRSDIAPMDEKAHRLFSLSRYTGRGRAEGRIEVGEVAKVTSAQRSPHPASPGVPGEGEVPRYSVGIAQSDGDGAYDARAATHYCGAGVPPARLIRCEPIQPNLPSLPGCVSPTRIREFFARVGRRDARTTSAQKAKPPVQGRRYPNRRFHV